MHAVNLLAYDAGLAGSRKPIQLPKHLVPGLAIAASVAMLAGVGYTYAGASSTVSSYLDELGALQTEKAEIAARAANTNATAVAERRLRESAVASALAYRVPGDNVLADIGYLLPRDIWVTALHVQVPKSPVPPESGEAGASTEGPAQTFTLSGYASSQARVAQVLEQLAKVPALVDVELQSSAKATLLENETITFTIVGHVREKGAN